MASSCISRCVNDTRTPVRATYVNLYKWPESDAQFIRSMGYNTIINNNGRGRVHDPPRPEVVDSISCRQLYLRSYTFSKKKDHKYENTKCFGRVKAKARDNHRRKRRARGGGGGRNWWRGGGRSSWRKIKEVSCAALVSVFRKLLFCTTKVEIVD